jgi:Domain of unknown function (DUF4349)
MRSSIPGDRTRRAIGVLIALTLTVGVLVAACGSAATSLSKVGSSVTGGGGAAQPAPAASSGGGGEGDVPTVGDGSGSGSNSGGGNALIDEAKIIRTGSIQVTVADVGKAVTSAHDAVRLLGGYVGASKQEGTKEQTVATVTYRVPAARWDDALTAVRGLGTVVSESTDATEVTGQLVDLDARIRNLKASETALVGYAEKAPKVSDLLEIEQRLTDTRGQIERLSAQQAQLQDQVALATLTATFGSDTIAVVQTAERWDPASEVDRAMATLIGIGQALVSAAIVILIVWLPVLLVGMVLVGIGLLVARRLGWWRPRGLPPIVPPEPPAPAAGV